MPGLPGNGPTAVERRRHAMELAEELVQFERPVPGIDEYDRLLGDTGVIQ